MSGRDDEWGGRTVIRPNPGGVRRGASPGLPPSSPRRDDWARPAGRGDGWSVSDEARQPVWARTGEAPGNWQAPRAGGDAGRLFPEGPTKEKPAAPTRKIALAAVIGAREGERMASANPLLDAAAPLLILIGRLRLGVVEMEAAPLMNHVIGEIERFAAKALDAGYSNDDARRGQYALCATADDIVQNLPSRERAEWLRYPMLARFFEVRDSGVEFFEVLRDILDNPAAEYDLLELYHACLSLGFVGMYRTAHGGDAGLSNERRRVYEALRRVKARPDDDISPRWQGQAIAARALRAAVPLWVVGSLAAVGLVGLFFTLRILLSGEAEAVAAELTALNAAPKVALLRPASAEIVTPKPPETSQLERIRSALRGEIDKGGLAVEPVGESITIRVDNSLLFDSGSADVTPAFQTLADDIAAALDAEPGQIFVTGHTDDVKLSGFGRFKSNQELSLARAKSVEAVLAANLDDPSRIVVEGRGADQPIADNATKEGQARNRRVEIAIPREETL
ncbi:type VI secretion system protein TssL, long form [Aurantimonas sp. 22II-16-19i]|uniref:type VI secretion system protein TssL, long form n=1 Tax=Aurantimonas sp. 22II-16-19i TaxID=1317114 RepID=UPI0009F7C2F9|nr:type VI secretion system protein TssL, long form [Aurantimonas sp. 22II-16-19i]ORE97228.1 type IV / vi secretion system protein, dotu family [Aurantimonas sp. 22II-16-19i]